MMLSEVKATIEKIVRPGETVFLKMGDLTRYKIEEVKKEVGALAEERNIKIVILDEGAEAI